jgi:hypothetical protein
MAKHHELTNSKDGLLRLTAKIEIRLTLQDIATAVVASKGFNFDEEEGRDEIIAKLVPSRRRAVEIATDASTYHGRENWWERVTSYDDGEEMVEAVLRHLEKLWA